MQICCKRTTLFDQSKHEGIRYPNRDNIYVSVYRKKNIFNVSMLKQDKESIHEKMRHF